MPGTTFGHDIDNGLNAAVDLVNTAPEIVGAESMTDAATLCAFLAAHRFVTAKAVDPEDLPAVRATRSRLMGILRARSLDDAVLLVNDLITETGTMPMLAAHDGHPWHMHYYAPGVAVADHVGAECGMSLALALASDGLDRFRECASPDCRRLLVDLSRNRCKRYCDSRTCGNRLHVAAYRARRRSSQGD